MRSTPHNQHHHVVRPLSSILFVLLVIALAIVISAMAPSPQPSLTGEEVLNRVCATCHAVNPPAEAGTKPIAPPMKMIVRRYMMINESEEAAQERIVEWLKGP